MKLKQVIVMRKDLNMRKGKMVAQGAHASNTVLMDYYLHPNISLWYNGAKTIISVYVNSEEELLNIYKQAESMNLDNEGYVQIMGAKIPCALIQDHGLTEFGGVRTYTCCAVGPASDELIDPITGDLPLL